MRASDAHLAAAATAHRVAARTNAGLFAVPPPSHRGCPALTTAPPHSITPEEFHKAIKKTGEDYSKSQLYAIMAALCMSPKSVTTSHANRARRRDVRRWQRRMDKRIAGLRARGYTIVIMDESHLVYDARPGRKYWSLVGVRVRQVTTGSHKRAAVFGALADGGRSMFRIYAKADSYAFIAFLKELTARFGKVAVIADRYSAHNSHVVRECIKKNRKEHPDRDIQMVCLPAGCPFLNAVEKCWSQLKKAVVVGEYHASFEDLCTATEKFLKSMRFGYSIEQSLYTDPPPDMIRV